MRIDEQIVEGTGYNLRGCHQPSSSRLDRVYTHRSSSSCTASAVCSAVAAACATITGAPTTRFSANTRCQQLPLVAGGGVFSERLLRTDSCPGAADTQRAFHTSGTLVEPISGYERGVPCCTRTQSAAARCRFRTHNCSHVASVDRASKMPVLDNRHREGVRFFCGLLLSGKLSGECATSVVRHRRDFVESLPWQRNLGISPTSGAYVVPIRDHVRFQSAISVLVLAVPCVTNRVPHLTRHKRDSSAESATWRKTGDCRERRERQDPTPTLVRLWLTVEIAVLDFRSTLLFHIYPHTSGAVRTGSSSFSAKRGFTERRQTLCSLFVDDTYHCILLIHRTPHIASHTRRALGVSVARVALSPCCRHTRRNNGTKRGVNFSGDNFAGLPPGHSLLAALVGPALPSRCHKRRQRRQRRKQRRPRLSACGGDAGDRRGGDEIT